MLASIRRCAWTSLTVLGIGCSSSAQGPNPDPLLTTYTGEAGTGFKLYFLSLTFTSVGDSVAGTWSLAYQTTCQTQDGAFQGVLGSSTLRLTLAADQPTEASFDIRLTPRADSTFRGEILSATPGTNPLCITDFADITLVPAIP